MAVENEATEAIFRSQRRGPGAGNRSLGQVPLARGSQRRSTARPQRPAARAAWTFSKYSIAGDNHPDGNEDAVLVDATRGIAAVFDGVGGSLGGAVAAQIARRVVRRGWKRLTPLTQGADNSISAVEGTCGCDVPGALALLLAEAHTAIRAEEMRRPDTMAGATTAAVVALYRRPRARRWTVAFAHAGDSRIYLVQPRGAAQRLTQDDGILTRLVQEQALAPADAHHIDQATDVDELTDMELALFQQRNGITQALGDDSPPRIHVGQVTIGQRDRIVVCSDGVHDNLTDGEIAAIVRSASRTTAARVPVECALRRSRQQSGAALRAKPDDMSAVVMTYDARRRAPRSHAKPQRRPRRV